VHQPSQSAQGESACGPLVVPHLRRSQDFAWMLSQPLRTGLTSAAPPALLNRGSVLIFPAVQKAAGRSKDRPLHEQEKSRRARRFALDYRMGPGAVATKEKARGRDGPARAGKSENDTALAGRESSRARPSRTAPWVSGLRERPNHQSRSRKVHRPSGQVAGPQPKAARVRFEFARRAHQREITPRVGINLARMHCQEERGDWEKKSEKRQWRMTSGGKV